MQQRLTKLSPHSVALHMALVFAVISLVFMLPFTFLMSAMAPNMPDDAGMPFAASGVLAFVMPIIYFIFTYIFSFIMALLYNLLAKMTGGVKVTLESSSD
ncbi:DUF3566 domain-containing protein [Alteromonas lipolytica]|uniref:DUF3566 domain-containing protein n=1 Tax=Alteromonas lipolytica TaxID=1856405 RepID=A0A1E8FAJ2_9ALTE|nr:DUF3566 domain-containing protein [Alteromonas lipolytica]OFI32944.1 hypothetical protein BFC17_01315 [Alteromonas lipolytica]GGF64025.1 hypothetical protein GCM10011338_15450 [Alteromonas lipolytica]